MCFTSVLPGTYMSTTQHDLGTHHTNCCATTVNVATSYQARTIGTPTTPGIYCLTTPRVTIHPPPLRPTTARVTTEPSKGTYQPSRASKNPLLQRTGRQRRATVLL